MKNNLIKSLVFLSLLGGSFITFTNASDLVISKANSSETKDMTNVAYWKAEEGNFFEFENWYTSGKGFSFEFKSTTGTYKNAPFVLSINGTNHATSSIYAWQNTNGTLNRTDSVGKCAQIDEDGWYRFELLFADVPSSKVTDASATITTIMWNFNWGETYRNSILMRDMKIITEYSEELNTIDVTGESGLSRWNNNFPFVENWGNSNKGIAFEYKPIVAENRIPIKLRVRNGSAATLSQWFLNGKAEECVGKDRPLSNGWRRYEVMPEDVFAIEENKAYATWEVFALEFQWAKPLEYGFSLYRNWGTISGYSYNVTFNVDGELTTKPMAGTVTLPNNPKKEGYHFIGWYIDEDRTQAFDENSKLTSDLTLYAKFEAHTFEKNYQYDNEYHWQGCECGESGPKVLHTYEEVVDDKYLVKSATCNKAATYKKSCVCGAISEETFESGSFDSSKHVPGEAIFENHVEPTCDTDGGYDENVYCEECHELLSSTHKTIDKSGHKYNAFMWELNREALTGTLKLVCENDPEHFEIVNATVELYVIEPTYEKVGQNIYTLVATFQGKTYTHTITDEIPVLEKEEIPSKSGCGGTIASTSAILAIMSLSGLLIAFKKKLK